MRRWDKQRWAALIVWGVVLASAIATFDAVWKVIRDDRKQKAIELSRVSLDAPLRAGAPITGRVLLINYSGSTIWMERAGNTHFWFEWTSSIPTQIGPHVRGGFRPCGEDDAASPFEVAAGPVWWCFRQKFPTLSDGDLDQLKRVSDIRLWFTIFVTYRTGEGKVRHARLCQVYNFEADGFQRSRRGSCDSFD
ncbi:hypothetical protein [Bradyrhizobium sp.]|uniref:hypothetical protein n=1 Tax=Bradyrhizobium sp. TaxID=376 RepID=UPI001D357D7C|nr:hypothetical protein [Bradyrhizobium sp.]MBI5319359.1 hypothetical protein [Bradyrhizobium sp.]